MACSFRSLARFTVVSSLLLASGVSRAAVTVPSSAEPSRAQGQIAAPPLSQPGAGAGRVSNALIKAPAGAEKIKFKLAGITFKGLTAYSEDDLKPFYQDKIGQTVSLVDIYVIANKITARYRNDGYILSQAVVEPQTIHEGHVRINIIEGYVHDIRMEGDKAGSLEPYLDKIKAERPFNFKKLERYLLLINDLPGISAKAVLAPAKVPGATDIIIIVSRKPYDLFFQADNRGSRYLGPLQLTTSARVNDALGLYEGINIQYANASLNNEMNYGSISYVQPVGHEGTQVTVGGSITDTRPGFTLASFDVHGVAQRIDFAVMHPFIRSRNESLFMTVRFNYIDSSRTDNTGGPRIDDRLSVTRLGSIFENNDRFGGANRITAEVSKGLDILGSTGPNDPNTTRPGADNTFWKGTAEISRVQNLTGPFDLFVSGTGQYSHERLLTSEQFGLGGASYGSAYDSSEITGDKGIAGRAELRMNNPFQTPLQLVQPYIFYDTGKVWDPGNTAAAGRIASLSSAGLGLRFSLNKNFSGTVEAAAPLTRDVGTTGNRHPRVFGALTLQF